MKKRTLLWLTPFIFILVGLGVWIGWTLVDTSNNIDNVVDTSSGHSVTQESDDYSTDVVNTPVSESIIAFQTEVGFNNGHEFISQFHNFYNETLGWGRIATASYTKQKEQAKLLIDILNNTDVQDEALKEDFNSIKNHAENVMEGDNRDSMRTLHRYFHDLDIILNGYDYNQTFGVTTFSGD